MARRDLMVAGALALAVIVVLPLPARCSSGAGALRADAGVELGLFPCTRFGGADGDAFFAFDTGLGGPALSRRPGAGGATVFAHRRTRYTQDWRKPESYLMFKGGGMYASEEPAAEGVFAGIEIGGTVEEVLDIGFSLDYFYRGTTETALLSESEVEHLPVQVVATLDESAAHLLPVGLTMRLRIPILGDRFTPFVSGTVAYESLFLQNVGDPNSSDPVQRLLENDETFTGFGWQAAAGMNLKLGPTLGLFGEVGLHHSSPKQEIELNGVPVDLKVDLDGPFLRGGLRFGI